MVPHLGTPSLHCGGDEKAVMPKDPWPSLSPSCGGLGVDLGGKLDLIVRALPLYLQSETWTATAGGEGAA